MEQEEKISNGCCCLRDNVDISVCVFKVCMLESGLCLFLCVICQRWKFIWIESQLIVIIISKEAQW